MSKTTILWFLPSLRQKHYKNKPLVSLSGLAKTNDGHLWNKFRSYFVNTPTTISYNWVIKNLNLESMKALIKLSLTVTFCFGFSLVQLQAQKSFQPNLLIGEWSMKGPNTPMINDTISLTKDLLNKLEYPRWIFEESNKIQITKYSDYNNSGIPQIAVSEAGPSEWSFDNSSNLLKIHHGTMDRYFKVIAKDVKSIKLIYEK